MRIGQNPAKSSRTVVKPERITVAVLNYIPSLSGYYAEMLDVLKASLNSLRETADLPYDLLVFDNGSCEEILQYLADEKQEGRIQYLMLSEKNLGKGGAWNVMLTGAPGEIIAYADNDVLYFPGWLSKSIQILETFPNVGMVTSRPFRTDADLYTSTIAWAEQTPDVRIERGNFIPWENFLEFDLSLGKPEDEIRERYETLQDVRLTYHGIQAMAGASHWQFVARKGALSQFLPFDMNRPMGQVKQLDSRMNDAGFLRLMPVEPLVMNISNSLRGINTPVSKQAGVKHRRLILDIPPVKSILLKLYGKIFRWYFDRDKG
jgi:glycosyltransferase involved in cell wall biosynthesis